MQIHAAVNAIGSHSLGLISTIIVTSVSYLSVHADQLMMSSCLLSILIATVVMTFLRWWTRRGTTPDDEMKSPIQETGYGSEDELTM